ncbi:MAG TPA: methyl-accepting chemotaxis protein [Burkholderiales bacterium]
MALLSFLSEEEEPQAPAPAGTALDRAQAVRRELTIWGALWAGFGLLAFMPLVWYIVNQESLKQQSQAAARMQLATSHLQRLAESAAAGSPAAFPPLREAERTIGATLEGLLQGSAWLDPAPARVLPLVSEINQQWQPVKGSLDTLLGFEKPLVTLERHAGAIGARETELIELAEQIQSTLVQGGGSARDLYHAGQLVAFATRMPQAARNLLARPNPEKWAAELDAGVRACSEALRALTPIAAVREQVEKLSAAYMAIAPDINTLVANLKPLGSAQAAAAPVLAAGEYALPESAQRLADALARQTRGGVWEGLLTAILAAAATGFAILFTRVLVREARGRQTRSETENRRNQEAILRLLDEMGSLAEGDLTVTASVTEDMTGAIADSINFTVSELRAIVQRINQTTERVTEASQDAQAVSSKLLDAAEKQSQEIQQTTSAVLQMAQSINNVSSSAAESATVAQQSLSAARKGTAAVENAISGMNEIRSQIQETAKRIKRLGESSQEIDEIVELISDITEQTNVLALNAAIQAASAGEAGRGFSVVAEEVQRLAERSAQATRQISGIVKTIQADTHDAVAAMERSTQGVVEGARLSDAAGQALAEIGEVSRDLANLITGISDATRAQADSATRVAANMRGILAITEQTTEGTKRTARSIGELAGLASELRGSVANFKV